MTGESASATWLGTTPQNKLTPLRTNSRAAATALSGSARSSASTTSTTRPSTPPLALIRSAAMWAPSKIGRPNTSCGPPSEVMQPMRTGCGLFARRPCARAVCAPAAKAAARQKAKTLKPATE